MPLKIIGIAGSLRKDSFNKKLLATVAALCPSDAIIETLDFSEVPVFNQDLEANMPPVVVEIKKKIKEADAILFVTPEYNYSIPGPLKNLIDWVSRPYGDSSWHGKPVAIMGASPGRLGTVRAQVALRQCFVFLDMHQVNTPEVLIGAAHEKFDAEGKFTDEEGKKLIIKLLEELIALTKKLKV